MFYTTYVFEKVNDFEDRRTLRGIARFLNLAIWTRAREGIIEIIVPVWKRRKFVAEIACFFEEQRFETNVFDLDGKIHVGMRSIEN